MKKIVLAFFIYILCIKYNYIGIGFIHKLYHLEFSAHTYIPIAVYNDSTIYYMISMDSWPLLKVIIFVLFDLKLMLRIYIKY